MNTENSPRDSMCAIAVDANKMRQLRRKAASNYGHVTSTQVVQALGSAKTSPGGLKRFVEMLIGMGIIVVQDVDHRFEAERRRKQFE